jgi:hypothetical protein
LSNWQSRIRLQQFQLPNYQITQLPNLSKFAVGVFFI